MVYGFFTCEEVMMETGALGLIFQDGEVILRQEKDGDHMYVIQEGSVEILKEVEGGEVRSAIQEQRDYFGEMAIFEHKVRVMTGRALGKARSLTIDKKNFSVPYPRRLVFSILCGANAVSLNSKIKL